MKTVTLATLSLAGLLAMAALPACGSKQTTPDKPTDTASKPPPAAPQIDKAYIEQRLGIYATVQLATDLSTLTDKERQMLPLLIQASQIMDDLFWQQAHGNKDELLASVQDPEARKLALIHYGPWDRLDNDKPFLPGVGAKPPGARFYPADMTKEEFAQANLPGKQGLYSLVQRNAQGQLELVPYHVAYQKELTEAAALLRQAAALAEDPGLRRYLELRAQALVTDDYQPSDLAWLDMKKNRIEVVIGPIETYEDGLFGYRAAYEGYVLIKDMDWSKRLARYASFLPALQRGLPVPALYKRETPGSDSDLNAYDVIYYAGHANAGSKTIAINLPNDEAVQLEKGTRRLQLKNAMRAKFDKILEPIANELVADEQRKHVTFDAFFNNVMFHEVAHGLGIKNTVKGRGTVRDLLKEHAGSLEEGKADILGLYMITKLREQGEIKEGDLMDNYVTFLAGLVRSVRFGASSAHGKANMVQFNFFQDRQAFTRDPATGKYRVDFARMEKAVTELSTKILMIQGAGAYDAAGQLLAEQGIIRPELQADLDRLSRANIPVDIVFEQGLQVLGLGQ